MSQNATLVHLRILRKPILFINRDFHFTPKVLLVLFSRLLARRLSLVLVGLPHSEAHFSFCKDIQALKNQTLQDLLVVPTLGRSVIELLPGDFKQLVQQRLAGGEHLYASLVGGGGAGDLLGHGGLFELLLILGVNGRDLLTDQLGLFNGELFVGLEMDFASFLERFLANEGRHLLQLGCDLERGVDRLARLIARWKIVKIVAYLVVRERLRRHDGGGLWKCVGYNWCELRSEEEPQSGAGGRARVGEEGAGTGIEG